MRPGQLLQEIFIREMHRFGRTASEGAKIIREFEVDSERCKTDSFFIFEPPGLAFHVQFEIVLRRSPDLAIVVWTDLCGDSLAMRCALVGERFVVREVVCCDAETTGGQMASLISDACKGRVPFDWKVVSNASAIVAAKEQWLRDAYSAGTPKELTPLH